MQVLTTSSVLAMSDRSPTSVVGCLLDVSGSRHEALESGRSDERAGERLYAVLRAALKLAQAEQRRDSHALVFVFVFGLNTAKCPPAVDLCGVIDALLDGHDNHRTGHELLIALANENNLAHVTGYIRTKLSDDEARIVYAYLRRHPERIREFVNAVPAAEQIQSVRRVAGAIGAVASLLVAGITADKGAAIVEDVAVNCSGALQLARRMRDDNSSEVSWRAASE